MGASKLRFDSRRKGWVERPESRLEAWARKPDTWHGGFLVGIAVGGFLYTIVLGLALLL